VTEYPFKHVTEPEPSAAADVTILLTTRGRHLHTLRWIYHANRISLPFSIIVADGDVHAAIANLLSNPQTFPRLSLEYRQYEDRRFTDFYRKCVDALRQVRTPYVMMSDNDDFLFPSGVLHAASFLSRAPDYVSSGAGVAAFAIRPLERVPDNVVGHLERVWYRVSDNYGLRDLADQSATVRALGELRQYMNIYYHVYRTEALRVIAQEILANDPSDLEIHEYFWAVRAATLGKIKSHCGFLSYLRQSGTSSLSAFTTDWVDHLLRSRFPQDYSAFASTIANAAAAVDGGDAAEIEAEIGRIYSDLLRRTIANRVLRYRFPRLFALKRFASRLTPRPRLPVRVRRKVSEAWLWRRLAADGADATTIATHATELRAIAETLHGKEFLEFVHAKAPTLLRSPRVIALTD
jgi:glycosyltransferase domain-containing protein